MVEEPVFVPGTVWERRQGPGTALRRGRGSSSRLGDRPELGGSRGQRREVELVETHRPWPEWPSRTDPGCPEVQDVAEVPSGASARTCQRWPVTTGVDEFSRSSLQAPGKAGGKNLRLIPSVLTFVKIFLPLCLLWLLSRRSAGGCSRVQPPLDRGPAMREAENDSRWGFHSPQSAFRPRLVVRTVE
jgi:hypothetical protein